MYSEGGGQSPLFARQPPPQEFKNVGYNQVVNPYPDVFRGSDLDPVFFLDGRIRDFRDPNPTFRKRAKVSPTVCPGSSDPPEKILNIFASDNENYTIF